MLISCVSFKTKYNQCDTYHLSLMVNSNAVYYIKIDRNARFDLI